MAASEEITNNLVVEASSFPTSSIIDNNLLNSLDTKTTISVTATTTATTIISPITSGGEIIIDNISSSSDSSTSVITTTNLLSSSPSSSSNQLLCLVGVNSGGGGVVGITSINTGGSGDKNLLIANNNNNIKEEEEDTLIAGNTSDSSGIGTLLSSAGGSSNSSVSSVCVNNNNNNNNNKNYNISNNNGNMFSDVFEGNTGEILKDHQTLEESCPFSDGPEKNCMICKGALQSPRILTCLHVFCERCLNNLIMENNESDNKANESFVVCPTCEQTTKVGNKGAASLICDYICTNILDLSTIEPKLIACTSCKSKEQAISRCNDCANFLCAGCDNAHKYMRCFENHEVVKLEDLQKKSAAEKVTIHKPLFCSVHTSENLKYYCFNCQTPVCNDCLIADHKGSEHHYDLISTAEKVVRSDVENLIKEAHSKVNYCGSAVSDLTSALNELQSQHDTARELIDETYKNFKAVIDKCRDLSLKDLGRLHSERELKIMDLLHVVEKTRENIEGVCKFTNRVLDQANAAEFLSMKKLIHSQFLNLISNIPKCDINYSLEFDTKFEKFDQLAQDTFGKFRTESTPPSPKESTPPPTLPGMPPMLMNRQNNAPPSLNTQQSVGGTSTSSSMGGIQQTTNGSSVTASSPISLPTSMQSSFDGDISGLGNGFMIPNVLNTDSPSNINHMNHMPHNNPIIGVQTQHHTQNNSLNGVIGGLGPVANSTFNNSTSSITPIIGGNSINNTIAGFNSIAEYNLQRLANLAENTPDLNDAIVPNIGASNGPTQLITLADILSGDQRAFNNFQALAKLGLNSNVDDFHTDVSGNHHLLTGNSNGGLRGPSPGIDSLLNDFVGLGATASPMPPLLGTDDISLANYQSGNNTGPPPAGGGIVPTRMKATAMQIRCKFGSLGQSKGQFNSPHGFCLGVDEEIIVADTNNHRIEVFEKNGAFKFQFGVPGKEEGQLWYPRKVAVMSTNGKFVVCDRGNERSRMQIFSKNGHFMKKIAIRYIDIVAGLAVTSKGQIVAVDSVSPTVFIISEEGDLIHWFDCSDYMREPSDIAIRDNDFYVCDFKGHCVVVFKDDGTFQYRIGNEKTTCFPNGIDISNAGDILIGDSHGNRFHVACFSRDGVLQSEFECPHVKVSRCCGLKITSEGFVVTLAKNNHHVLVLNTLYVH